MKHNRVGFLGECLLAYQFQERDDDGMPSRNARLGAYFLAEQYMVHRAFMQGFGGEE